MGRLVYKNDARMKVKIHSNGTRSDGVVTWRKSLTHTPCGCLVTKTHKGFICSGCGNIAPNMENVVEVLK